jgi:hypothetical protein
MDLRPVQLSSYPKTRDHLPNFPDVDHWKWQETAPVSWL